MTETTTAEPKTETVTATEAPPAQLISRIDAKFDPKATTDIAIEAGHGVMFRTLPQLIEAAKLMSRSDICVPPHCRNEAGVCFAILMRTENWRLRDPFFVAEHSYVVEKSMQIDGSWQKVKTLAFDASVFHAVLLANAPIRDRVEFNYIGDGDDRTCTASVQLLSGKWVNHTSPPMKTCHPGHREKDGVKYVKGSPLWDKNPDQQLSYFTVRDLARKYFPDVLGGIYDKDEFEETPADPVEPATPKLLERLPGKIEGAGFSKNVVDASLADAKPATEKADPVATAAKEVKAAKTETKQLPVPKNLKEYKRWVTAWAASINNAVEIMERWKSERALRNQCEMLVDQSNEIKKTIIDVRIKALSK